MSGSQVTRASGLHDARTGHQPRAAHASVTLAGRSRWIGNTAAAPEERAVTRVDRRDAGAASGECNRNDAPLAVRTPKPPLPFWSVFRTSGNLTHIQLV
jgi:hypothetical protein